MPLKDWDYVRYGKTLSFAFTANPRFRLNYYYEFDEENASVQDTYSYVEILKMLFPSENMLNEPAGHFAAMALAYFMATRVENNDNINLYDFVKIYAQDLGQSFLDRLKNIVSMKDVFDLLHEDFHKYDELKAFLDESIEYWSQQEDQSPEAFAQWAFENADRIAEVKLRTGINLACPDDLLENLLVLAKWVRKAYTYGKVIGCLIDI